MDRMDRAKQLAENSPDWMRSLPAVRGEDDIHVPHQGPDNVVGGEVPAVITADRAAVGAAMVDQTTR